MILMAVYVGFLIIGEVIAYAIGTIVDQEWPSASLLVFLVLFFAMFWFAWILAVRTTARWEEPSQGLTSKT
ncbi:MAG TPA: hypothetical protein VHA77_16285 [Xanthobacteraceae bacterium]|nr:hypothetical protein [Xanthobacteraceae bacterium]